MAEERKALVSLSDEELIAVIGELGQSPFRAKQIRQWLLKGALFSEMTNLPKDLREVLAEKYTELSLSREYEMREEDTDTTKFLLRTADDIIIESVGLIYDGKLTVCVSTQAGCAMGCSFCSSTVGGLIRNLTSSEMLSQLILASRITGLAVSNIVLMGSGEPLNNYENVKEFLLYIMRKDTLNIGIRHITLSTCGIVPGIDRMREDALFVNLSLSLHCAVGDIRVQLMPVEKKYHLEDAFSACMRFRQASGRRITLEYCVVEGLNDTEQCARALKDLMRGTDSEVNLIDYNKKEGYRALNSRTAADRFSAMLTKYGIDHTLRRRLGSSINAACGQLKSTYVKDRQDLK
ncbi:MAG: 23S rRNA (adenine(2503)-C(2))-methyltransferase RlmN [Eubacteriaceae bacterium]|nr:23S rRNA (adenine(2503)-C(2))-methyltransferase RlmN [Eubacteriaceae bacterium]